MVEWGLVVVGIAIAAQLFRTNALLRGIYVLLEKHHRPPGETCDRWVAQLERGLAERYPDAKRAALNALGGISIFAAGDRSRLVVR